MLVDSHCHLDRLKLEEHGGSLGNALKLAQSRGVSHFLAVSVTLDGFARLKQIAAEHPSVSLSCGVHPMDTGETPLDPALLRELAKDDQVVAIGETGLDYYYSADSAELQKTSFRHHIQVARELKKPLIVHTRDARQDTLDILSEEQAQAVGGVLHCFTESLEMAEAAMAMGFYISLSGIVTFANAKALREVARAIPLERLLVETDAPYLAPVPHRGKSNQPAFVRDVAEYLATLKGVPFEVLAEQTTRNFQQLFRVDLQSA